MREDAVICRPPLLRGRTANVSSFVPSAARSQEDYELPPQMNFCELSLVFQLIKPPSEALAPAPAPSSPMSTLQERMAKLAGAAGGGVRAGVQAGQGQPHVGVQERAGRRPRPQFIISPIFNQLCTRAWCYVLSLTRRHGFYTNGVAWSPPYYFLAPAQRSLESEAESLALGSSLLVPASSA